MSGYQLQTSDLLRDVTYRPNLLRAQIEIVEISKRRVEKQQILGLAETAKFSRFILLLI
jgi:hypothetical protein